MAFLDAKPRGLLRVNVHGTPAHHFLLPGLPAFLAQYPGLQLHIGAGDRFVDLARDRATASCGPGNPGTAT